jgi:hypothetical protein
LLHNVTPKIPLVAQITKLPNVIGADISIKSLDNNEALSRAYSLSGESEGICCEGKEGLW